MDESLESALLTIKKLFALSKKNSNENEAASAAAKAQELLIRYNLSEEQVNKTQDRPPEPVIGNFYTGHRTGQNVQQWKVLLAFDVAAGNLCKALSHSQGERIEWIGKKSNIEVAQYLYETLLADLERISEETWKTITELRLLEKKHHVSLFKGNTDLRFVHGKTWRNSFYLGAVETIGARLRQGLNTLKEENNILALIVVADQEVANYIRQKYPRMGKFGRNNTAHSSSGYASGRATGESIQFKRGINGAGGSHGPKLITG